MLKNKKLSIFSFLMLAISLMFSFIGLNFNNVKAETVNTLVSTQNYKTYTNSVYNKGEMPLSGNVNLLVFYINFLNGEDYGNTPSATELEKMLFDDSSDNTYQGEDSVRSFYSRASYSKLKINGKVYERTTNKEVYSSEFELFTETLNAYKQHINWDIYDSNKDNYIDGIIFIAKNNSINLLSSYYSFVNSNLKVGNIKTFNVNNVVYFNEIPTLHQLQEVPLVFMGLDFHKFKNNNPSGIKADIFPLTINNTTQMYDISGIAKYWLGWAKAITITGEGSGSYNLNNCQEYDEVLLIYPNGNKNSKFLFLIEYLTKAKNNIVLEGLRVWKVIPDDNGSFKYIEAINDGSSNYLLTKDSLLDPYTNPSTSYSEQTYKNGIYTQLNNLILSGITIEVGDLNAQSAAISVTINNNYYGTNASTAYFYNKNTSNCDYLITNKMLIASIKANEELVVVDESIALEFEDGKFINIDYDYEENGKVINLYADVNNLIYLNKESTYSINLKDKIKSYYGSSVYLYNQNGLNIDSSSVEVTIENVPNLLIESNINEISGITNDLKFKNKYIQTAQNEFITVENNYKGLYLGKVNTQNNTSSCILLLDSENIEIPLNSTVEYWVQSSGSENVLFVLAYDQTSSYIGVFGLDGTSYSNGFFGRSYRYVGDNKGSFIVDESNNSVCELTYTPGKLPVPSVIYTCSETVKAFYKISDSNYIFVGNNNVFFIKENQLDSSLFLINSNCCSVNFINNNIYVLTIDSNINLRVFDTNYNEIDSVNILNNLPILTNKEVSNINYSVTEDYKYVSFDAFTLQGTKSSFILKLDENNNLKSYYVTNKCGSAFVLDDNKIFMGCGNNYFTVEEKQNHNHNYNSELVSATCLKSGFTKHSCTICNATYTTGYSNKLEHQIINVVDYKPTCVLNGLKHEECVNCNNKFYTSSINSVGHTQSEWVVDKNVDCEHNGHKYKFCLECAEVIVEEDILCEGHTFDTENWVIDIPATCTKNGQKSYHCTKCNQSDVNSITIIEATGHNCIKDVISSVESTCSKSGYDVCICSNPGCNYKEIVQLDLLEHVESDWIEEQSWHCCKKAYKECVNCEMKIKEAILPPDGEPNELHEYERVEIAPTCTQQGYIYYICKYCNQHPHSNNQEYKEEVISEVGHDYGKWHTSDQKMADYFVEESNCSRCDSTLYKQTPVKSSVLIYEYIIIVLTLIVLGLVIYLWVISIRKTKSIK